jgi:hypothetical protein
MRAAEMIGEFAGSFTTEGTLRLRSGHAPVYEAKYWKKNPGKTWGLLRGRIIEYAARACFQSRLASDMICMIFQHARRGRALTPQ